MTGRVSDGPADWSVVGMQAAFFEATLAAGCVCEASQGLGCPCSDPTPADFTVIILIIS